MRCQRRWLPSSRRRSRLGRPRGVVLARARGRVAQAVELAVVVVVHAHATAPRARRRSSMSSRRIQTAGSEAASVRFLSPLVWTSALSSAAMSLAFLSKKGWHTSNLQNVEKVWLAEQKQEKEAKRVLELQKQIEEERQIDDLRALQRNQGLVTDPREKLEWMYEGPSSGAGQDRESVGGRLSTSSARSTSRARSSRMSRRWRRTRAPSPARCGSTRSRRRTTRSRGCTRTRCSR